MNKAQLVDALTARIGDRRAAASAVDGLLEIIVETVSSGGSVTLTGFGVFETRARAARVARNPRTGETVPVAPTTVPAFRPGTAFKALVSGTGGGDQENGTGARPARRPRPAARAAAAAAAPSAAPEVAAPAGAARATRSFSAPEVEQVKPAKARKAKATKEAGDKGKGDKGKAGKPAKKAKGRK